MKINSAFTLRHIYNMYLLVPVRRNGLTSEAIALNDSAALIFLHCEEAENARDLAEILSGFFTDEDKEAIVRQLTSYITSLIDQGFLEVKNK